MKFNSSIKMLTLSVVTSMMLIGCGSSGGDATAPSTSTQTGIFVDSAVAGLNYTCTFDGSTGVTNAAGEFTCLTGSNVEFSVGGYVLGNCTIGAVVTPYSLYPNNSAAAVNVAQLLQTIDSDNDPLNGITIPDGYSDLDAVTTAPTDALFDTLISAVTGVLVTEQEAQDHLNTTLDLPTVTDGFTQEYLDAKTFYAVYDWRENISDVSNWALVREQFDGTNHIFNEYNTINDSYGADEVEAYEIIDGIIHVTVSATESYTQEILSIDADKITLVANDFNSIEYFYFDEAKAKVKIDELNAPSVENGFTAEWTEGQTLYLVIQDTQDDDNDGSTTDWLLVAMMFENGNWIIDFSADGTVESSDATYEIIDGVIQVSYVGDDGSTVDQETFTITDLSDTKITVLWGNNWGSPDETDYLFYTKTAAEDYINSL